MKFSPGVVPQWPSSRGLMCSSCERLAQQRVVEQVDLPDGEVVGGPPVGVHPGPASRVERGHGASSSMIGRSLRILPPRFDRAALIVRVMGMGVSCSTGNSDPDLSEGVAHEAASASAAIAPKVRLRRGSSRRRSCRCSRCPTAARRTSRSRVTTFSPPMAAPLPGRRVSLAVIGSPASVAGRRPPRARASRARLLLGRGRRVDARVVRRAELGGQLAVMLARILAGAGGDLRGQQAQDQAVLVRGPHRAVAPQEAGAGALLAAEADGCRRTGPARTT